MIRRPPRSTLFPYTNALPIFPLPSAVRAAAESALGTAPVKEEFAWMSWAGTVWRLDRKSTRLNSSHLVISYAVFCLKKKTNILDYPLSWSLSHTSPHHLSLDI